MTCLVALWPATPQLFPTSLLLPVFQDTQSVCTAGPQEDQDWVGSSPGISPCIPEGAVSCSDRGRVRFLGGTDCGLTSRSSRLEGTGQGGRHRQRVREQLPWTPLPSSMSLLSSPGHAQLFTSQVRISCCLSPLQRLTPRQPEGLSCLPWGRVLGRGPGVLLVTQGAVCPAGEYRAVVRVTQPSCDIAAQPRRLPRRKEGETENYETHSSRDEDVGFPFMW